MPLCGALPRHKSLAVRKGVNDGSTKYPSPINPIFCAKYVILTVIIGVNKNGIANIALNTIGPPKIIGSLIPHIPGIIESLPRDFK